MPYSAASDQSLQCLPLIQQVLDTLSDFEDLFMYKDKFGKDQSVQIYRVNTECCIRPNYAHTPISVHVQSNMSQSSDYSHVFL